MIGSLQVFLTLTLFLFPSQKIPGLVRASGVETSAIVIPPMPGAAGASPAPQAETAAPSVDPMSYTYNPFGKRDPFRPFLLDHSIDKSNSDPLLNFDITKFKVTGILSGIANPRALVKDGENKGHIIYKGTHIGRNKGQVISISRDRVLVAEEFRDPLGKLIVTEVTMKLEKERK